MTEVPIARVQIEAVHRQLRFQTPLTCPSEWKERQLSDWSMEFDDKILRYLYRESRPQRHLEFGTWEGSGVLRCLEECDATVWTINLLEGETRKNGEWAYASNDKALSEHAAWSERLETDGGTWVRTDAYDLVGRQYLRRGFGHRVCQIYCDSRRWDTSNYPPGFFDSVFIDGGHSADVVINDTRKALRLLRPGGMAVWHDYCPLPEVRSTCESVRGVAEAVLEAASLLECSMQELFWIDPSWLLVGVRNSRVLAVGTG